MTWQPNSPDDLWNIDALREALKTGTMIDQRLYDRQVKGSFLVIMPDGKVYKNLTWEESNFLFRNYKARVKQTSYDNPKKEKKRTLPTELRKASPGGEQPPI